MLKPGLHLGPKFLSDLDMVRALEHFSGIRDE